MMRKKLAMILAAAMAASLMTGSAVFAEEADAKEETAAEETTEETASGDTMTMDEVVKAVQESEVPSDLKLGYVCMNLANPWFVEVVEG